MIGKTVSHYRILEKLGEGGMGVVYKAEDLKLQRFVALKFLPHGTRDDDARKRFVHEAQAASSLEHPNICSIHEIDETPEGRLFMVMPCYEGESLETKIRRGPLGLDEAIEITIQVASGLARAHEKGIIHRDIKPGNIFVTGDGLPKILDFGLAKLESQTKLTRAGATVGTVAYMSPEQARGVDVDRRSDIWSLGALLYEMITGRVPFQSEHAQAVLYSILNEYPAPVTSLRTGVPLELERVIDKALSKEREERYQHADEIVADLSRVRKELAAGQEGRPTSAAEPAAKGRWRRVAIPAAVAVVLLAVGVFLVRSFIFGDVLVSAPKPIAVISFENRTGDESYDYLREAIPNLLITSLEQSKYLRVVTWERLRDLLKQQGHRDVKVIDDELGFAMCRLDGVDTIVLGSFTRAGETFATDAKVLDVHTKQLLTSVSARGQGVGSILDTQIDDLSQKIAKTVGLSEVKIAASSRPIMQVTTTSMDAYNYYLKGREEIDKHYYHDAVRFLEKAVALDSTFAGAHLTLGAAYAVVRKGDASRKAYEKAMLYSSTAAEKERLYIEATYARAIERQPEKSFRVLRELVEKYPAEKRAHLDLGNDYRLKGMYREAIAELEQVLSLDPTYAAALNTLAYTYSSMGEYEKALECFQRYSSASPGDANPLDSMAELYFRWGKLNEAVDKYKEALEVKPDFGAERLIAYIYGFEENYPEALKWVDQFISRAPSKGTRGEGYFWRGWLQTMRGNTTGALEDLAKASAVFDSLGTSWGVVGASFTQAVAHQMRGESALGRADMDEGLEVVRGQYEDGVPPRIMVYYNIFCLLNGLTEDRRPVRERLKETRALLPRIAKLQGVQSAEWAENACDLLEGEELLRAGSVDDAIRVANASPSVGMPPMGAAYLWYYNCPVERDVLARALAKKGDLDKAIGEYEKLVTFDPNQDDRLLVLPIYHYRLARIYEQKGRTGEALREYQKFLTIMAEADVYLSEIEDANARVAVLTKRGS